MRSILRKPGDLAFLAVVLLLFWMGIDSIQQAYVHQGTGYVFTEDGDSMPVTESQFKRSHYVEGVLALCLAGYLTRTAVKAWASEVASEATEA